MPSAISHRLVPSFIVGLLVIALMGFLGASVVLATVTGQPADYRVTSHDLGVVSDFVSASTVVHTPAGDLAGPTGVEAFVGSLQRDYPDAHFAIADIQHVGRLIIVDWQGTSGDTIVSSGRTLLTVEDGQLTRLTFLNLNDTAPVNGTPSWHSNSATVA